MFVATGVGGGTGMGVGVGVAHAAGLGPGGCVGLTGGDKLGLSLGEGVRSAGAQAETMPAPAVVPISFRRSRRESSATSLPSSKQPWQG